jgi:hypothetical protein
MLLYLCPRDEEARRRRDILDIQGKPDQAPVLDGAEKRRHAHVVAFSVVRKV